MAHRGRNDDTVLVLILLLACATPPESRCSTDGGVACDYETTVLRTAAWPRRVLHQVPLGEPPEEGWPAVILFQGLSAPAETFWGAPETQAWGWTIQASVTARLLDEGFAVITPVARGLGLGCWDTNLPPLSRAWEQSPDHALMVELFRAIEAGELGPLDADRLYAGGISSGGYMSSRVALEYPDHVRAVAVHSGSYATCAGLLCRVPEELPLDHPPTLFLHGEADHVVPIETMRPYAQRLQDQGTEVLVVEDEELGHAWHDEAPERVLDWFLGR
jgi:pimeloyl-ACP methyl ester carboxylesterase